MCKLRGHERPVSAQGADPADPTGHRRWAIADAGGSTDSVPLCTGRMHRWAYARRVHESGQVHEPWAWRYEPPNDILGRAVDVRVVQHLGTACIKVVPAAAWCIVLRRMSYATCRLRITCCSCVLRAHSGTAPLVSYRGGTHTGLCVYHACVRARAGGCTRSPGSHSLSR